MKRVIIILMLFLPLCVFGQTKIIEKKDTDREDLKQINEKQVSKDQTEKQSPKEKKNQKESSKKEEVKKSNIWQESKQTTNLKTKESNKIKRPMNMKEIQDRPKWKNPHADSNMKPLKYKKHHHTPLTKLPQTQQIYYSSPIEYHYHINPIFIYRGIWIRYYFVHDDGFFFYNGYPYYVYHNYIHRYSFVDPGFYDLVDSYTDEVYATFYGKNLKESYDRAAEIRDILNNAEGEYRYFCAERFEYDPDYYYGWDPADFPDWYWE